MNDWNFELDPSNWHGHHEEGGLSFFPKKKYLVILCFCSIVSWISMPVFKPGAMSLVRLPRTVRCGGETRLHLVRSFLHLESCFYKGFSDRFRAAFHVAGIPQRSLEPWLGFELFIKLIKPLYSATPNSGGKRNCFLTVDCSMALGFRVSA